MWAALAALEDSEGLEKRVEFNNSEIKFIQESLGDIPPLVKGLIVQTIVDIVTPLLGDDEVGVPKHSQMLGYSSLRDIQHR